MAYFSKEVYERKREWVARRAEANKSIKTLTEAQHDAIAEICSIRHDLHCNSKYAFISESAMYREFDFYPSEWEYEDCDLVKIIKSNNLPDIKFTTTRTYDNWLSDYDWNEDGEYDMDENEDEYYDAYKEAFEKTMETLNQLDDDVRRYLKMLDEMFGTDYAPSQPL